MDDRETLAVAERQATDMLTQASAILAGLRCVELRLELLEMAVDTREAGGEPLAL